MLELAMNFLYYWTLVNVLSSCAEASYLRSTMVVWQARNQLETLGEWSVFWEGPKFLNYVQQYIQRIFLGERKIFQGGFVPLASPSYGPVVKHGWLNTMAS